MVKFRINKSCHNPGNSNDINMKLRPLTKLGKSNMMASKNLTMTPCRHIMRSLLSFGFMANFEQSGSSGS